MTLAEIQDAFVKISGRKDLDTSTGTFNAGLFIRSGSRYLDIKYPPPHSLAWYKTDLSADEYSVELNYCRAVMEVRAQNVDGETELDRKNIRWWRENHDTDSTGAPLYWALGDPRLAPQQSDLTALNYTDEFTYGAEDIIFSEPFNNSMILINPVVDEAYTIMIKGRFFSTLLSETTHKNFWSENYPETLIFAAMLQLERMYRNREGANAWVDAIAETLRGMEIDISEQEMVTEDIYL